MSEVERRLVRYCRNVLSQLKHATCMDPHAMWFMKIYEEYGYKHARATARRRRFILTANGKC